MDEEQTALASPIAGGLRGIRRSVSSGIFSGRPTPPPQPDPQTTNLLNQNSLTLTNVSQQLTTVTNQVSQLSNSLLQIKSNLAISDQVERQREAEKQRREALLAEQGLREGKESALEKKIQSALLFPVRRVAQKAQGILSRFAKFMFILAAGWLTNQTLQFFKLKSEGNIDALSRFKRQFLSTLLFGTSIVLLLNGGLLKIISAFGFIAAKALRLKVGSLLRVPFVGILGFLGANVDAFRKNAAKIFKKLADEAPPTIAKVVRKAVTDPLAIFGGLGLGVKAIQNKFFPKAAKEVGTEVAQGGAKGFFKNLVKGGLVFDAILEPVFGFFEYKDEIKDLEEKGLDTDRNKKRAAFGQGGGALAALTTTLVGLTLFPEASTSIVGGIGLALVSTFAGEPIGDIIGRTIAGKSDTPDGKPKEDKKEKGELKVDGVATEKNIVPVNKNSERIFDVSNLDDSPQFLPFPLAAGDNANTGGVTTSDKSSQVQLPNISSGDNANTSLGISNSVFNLI